MSKQENKVVLNCTLGGTLKYPKKEGDTVKYALAISEVSAKRLNELVKEKFGTKTLTIKPEEDSDLYILNVKSNFNVPVYDKDKNLLEDTRLYHGAEVYANISVKEYNYMNRTGITAYLSGIILLQNGEPTGQSFDTMMNNLI